jgi:hypothetical protein
MGIVRKFLADESGFLPLIGGLLGKMVGSALTMGAGGAVGAGSVVGGLLGSAAGQHVANKKAVSGDLRRQLRLNRLSQRGQYKEIRREAAKGMFHPLELLRAGGGIAGSTPLASTMVQSMAAQNNSFDQIDRLLTGQVAAAARASQLKNNIERIKADEARRGTLRKGAPDEEYVQRQPHGPGTPMARPTVWNGGSITLVGPNGPAKFPKRYADYFGVKDGDPLTIDLMEQLVGDEVGQLIFADIAANIGLGIRVGDDRHKDRTLGNMTGSFSSMFDRKPLTSPTMRIPDPEPGWMDRMYK